MHALKYKITKIFDWLHFHVTLINSPMSKMHKPFADFLLNVIVLQKPSLYLGCILRFMYAFMDPQLYEHRTLGLIMRETSYCCWRISDYPYFSILAISSVVPYQYHQPFCDVPLPVYTEPVFLNVYGAPESIPRNEFRQPMQPGGPVR